MGYLIIYIYLSYQLVSRICSINSITRMNLIEQLFCMWFSGWNLAIFGDGLPRLVCFHTRWLWELNCCSEPKSKMRKCMFSTARGDEIGEFMSDKLQQYFHNWLNFVFFFVNFASKWKWTETKKIITHLKFNSKKPLNIYRDPNGKGLVFQASFFKGRTVKLPGGVWLIFMIHLEANSYNCTYKILPKKIIPVSKWLITMVRKFQMAFLRLFFGGAGGDPNHLRFLGWSSKYPVIGSDPRGMACRRRWRHNRCLRRRTPWWLFFWKCMDGTPTIGP